jgi:hypothetical protein
MIPVIKAHYLIVIKMLAEHGVPTYHTVDNFWSDQVIEDIPLCSRTIVLLQCLSGKADQVDILLLRPFNSPGP